MNYKIDYYFPELPEDVVIKYVVIISKYGDKWIVVRHQDRTTWEIPGGHIEPGETPDKAAHRELFEETGAVVYALQKVCGYSLVIDDIQSFGYLYFADITELDTLPEMEIVEIKIVDHLPDNLTYARSHPHFFEKVKDLLNL